MLLDFVCRYDYLCVIYRWDKLCRASEQWIHQMGVHNLPRGPRQPFYGVLVSDNTTRYAAEGLILSFRHSSTKLESVLQYLYFLRKLGARSPAAIY